MEIIREKYKGAGLKLTPQRLAILDYLEGNTDHPSAEEIFCAVRKRYPAISFATVYNTIDTLKKRGDLTELNIDPVRKHYDPDTRVHHHIICTECGKIGDIFDDELGLDPAPASIGEYKITSWYINFSGLCSQCR